VALVRNLGSADEHVIGERGPGEFVGEQNLFDPEGVQPASARAIENTLLLEMTQSQFNGLLSRNPTLTYAMLRAQSANLTKANEVATRELYGHNQELKAALTELQAAQERCAEQEVLTRELQLAHEIQTRMLPAVLPTMPGYDLGARSVPARMVGGDFYDVFPLDSERLGIAVGDVSGKGIPAALLMGLTCALLRVESYHAGSPEEVVSRVNRHLLERNAEEFVTLLYGVLFSRSGVFSYARAGHELPLIANGNGAKFAPMEKSLPLGLFPELRLDLQSINLPPETTLVLYTDGVTEAFHPQKGSFGEAGLLQAVDADPRDSSQALCDQILNTVSEYNSDAGQQDDITILAVRAH
jgi:sigma-B regulation protein RsbU (phosphoserine phosphatase)